MMTWAICSEPSAHTMVTAYRFGPVAVRNPATPVCMVADRNVAPSARTTRTWSAAICTTTKVLWTSVGVIEVYGSAKRRGSAFHGYSTPISLPLTTLGVLGAGEVVEDVDDDVGELVEELLVEVLDEIDGARRVVLGIGTGAVVVGVDGVAVDGAVVAAVFDGAAVVEMVLDGVSVSTLSEQPVRASASAPATARRVRDARVMMPSGSCSRDGGC